jgi:F-type H+-transporting ATPase subunit a
VANDPIHQFQISKLIPIEIGGLDFSFTNSSLFMVATAIGAGAFLYLTTSSRGLIPSRAQSVSEMSYEFVANMLRDAAGTAGMKFFPLVFSLFMFVLVANLFGMFPYFFTVTSHLIVTFALAMLVIGTVVVYGFWKHGFGFLKLFVPHGVPALLVPLVVLIEVISFLSRPISLSVRLFANMLAGHITLKVFAGFRHLAVGARRCRRGGRNAAAVHDGRADRSRIPRRFPAGLRLRSADLHVSQRRDPPGSLIFTPSGQRPGYLCNEHVHQGDLTWKQKQQSTSALASRAWAWAAQALAWAPFSAITWRARCAIRRPLTASSAA